jgi:threonine dehydrogenase-like Zn-dependent dehydrogenase
MRAALELLQAGRVDPLELVSHRVALADTARALDLARSGQALKAVVVP